MAAPRMNTDWAEAVKAVAATVNGTTPREKTEIAARMMEDFVGAKTRLGVEDTTARKLIANEVNSSTDIKATLANYRIGM